MREKRKGTGGARVVLLFYFKLIVPYISHLYTTFNNQCNKVDTTSVGSHNRCSISIFL